MIHDIKTSYYRNLSPKTHIPLLLVSIATGFTAAYLAHYLVSGPLGVIMSLMPSWRSVWIALVSTFGLGLGESRHVDLGWYPPRNTSVNDLDTALHGTGVYGFIFNSSHTPDAAYGTYNWCNMPHVRKREYVKAEAGYKLRYVEVVRFCLSRSFLS